MPKRQRTDNPPAPPPAVESSNGVPLLDPAETNQPTPDRSSIPPEVQPGPLFRERCNVVNRLHRIGHPAIDRKAVSIASCCLGAYLATTADDRLVVVPSVCRQRLCPVCSRSRAARVQAQILALLSDVKDVRLGTLTLKASDAPFREVLDRLLSCYRQLRRTELWKKTVRGAVAVVQVTRGRSGDHWHVHLHFVWDGDFMPHARLRDEWQRITGDSYVVSLNGQGSGRDAARYVSRYVSSPDAMLHWPDDVLREYVLGLVGRRTLITSGSWHGSGVGTSPKRKDSAGVLHLVGVGQLVNGHKLGIAECTETLCLLHLDGWLGRQLSPLRVDIPPPTTPEERSAHRAALRDSAIDAARALDAYSHQLELETSRHPD